MAEEDRAALEALIAADVRALTAQSDQIGHAFAARHGLSDNDFRALLHVMVAETSGDPLAAGGLRARMGMSGAAITYLVERMIASGHVLREPDPGDRRKVKLRVAEHGVAVAREFFTPVLEIFRNTAALAILPVFMLLLGIGETSKIAIVLYACFFPILLSTITGVATVDPRLLRSARVLGLSPVATFRKVVFPAAIPTIFTGIRISGAAAILVLIAAEMIGAPR